MSRTDELLQDLDREVVADDLDGAEDGQGRSQSGAERRGRLGRLGGRLGSVFSPRGFLVAFALTLGAFLLTSAVVPFVGGIAGLVGVFAAGFLLGLAGRRRYLELAVAGAATAGVGALLDQLILSFVGGFALPLAAIGATAGLGAAVLGHYFGRDLRDGVTRSV